MPFEINLSTETARRNVRRLNRSVDVLNARLDKVNSKAIGMQRIGDSARNIKAGAGVGAVAIQNLARSSAQLKDQVNGVSASVTNLHKDVMGRFKSSTGKANKELRQFHNTMATTSKRAAVLRSAMYATGTHFGAFTGQTILAATVAYAFIKSITATIAAGAKFEERMARANAVMGNFNSQGQLVADRADMLDKKVRHLGATTVFTVNEVADGLVYLGMAGLNSSEAAEALSPVLDLAAVGMMEMGRAADIATNIMLGFDKSAKDLTDIVDIMSTAVISSNMNVEQLGNSLSYVAPISQSTNNSLKDTVAILESFHDVGIKGSRAGTSLRRALVNLSKPTDIVKGVLTKLNISLYDQQNKMRPLINIMRQLRDSQASVSDILTLFGARAGPAMVKLYQDLQKEVDGTTSSFQKHRDELEASAGAAKKLRDNIENVLTADWKKLVSALSELAIKIFEVIGPGLRTLVQALTKVIIAMDTSSVVKFTLAVTGLGLALKLTAGYFLGTFGGLKKFASATSAAIIPTRALAGALRFLAGPAGLIMTVVGGVVAYALAQRKSSDETKVSNAALQTQAERLQTLRAEQEGFNSLKKEEQELVKAAAITLLQEQAVKYSRAQAAYGKERVRQEGLIRQQAEEENTFRARNLYIKLRALQELQGRQKKTIEGLRKEMELEGKILSFLKERVAMMSGKEVPKSGQAAEVEKAANKLMREIAKEKVLDYKSAIALQKELTQGVADEYKIRVSMKEVTKFDEARANLEAIAREQRNVNSALDEEIQKQQYLEAQARNSALLAIDPNKKGGRSGIPDIERTEKAWREARETLDKLNKSKANYNKLTEKQKTALRALLQTMGQDLITSYRTAEEAEDARHKNQLAKIAAHYGSIEAMSAEHKRVLEREEDKHNTNMLQSFNTRAQAVLGGLGQLVGAMVSASSARYQMAEADAQKAWSLYEESVSRQEQFQNAANAAQSAGDREYYQNLANQYKNYSQQYQAQAEQYDKIAEQRFEDNKKLQIAQTTINTASGAMQAIGQFGYWGIPIAAAIIDQGKQMVSLIRSQEYQSPNAGFGGAFGGLPAAPDETAGVSNISDTPRSDGQTNALNVYIDGFVNEDMVYDVIVPVLQDGVNNKDVVIINGSGADSAQLSEVQGTN